MSQALIVEKYEEMLSQQEPSDTLGREFDPGKRDFSH